MILSKGTLYVGCSLTKATDSFKTEVEKFKAALRADDHEVFDFVGLINGTAEEVYNWDIGHCVRDCDALIAICDEPSIGLGWEIGEAVRLGKPVLAVAHKNAKVSRLILGAAEVEPNLDFQRYDQLLDIVPLAAKLVIQR